MAEEDDLFALASLWGPQAAAGHHTAKGANAQQAAACSAAGQAAADQAAADQPAGQATADQEAADQAVADQAASDQATSDQAAKQVAADQAPVVPATADTQQLQALDVSFQATAANTIVILQLVAMADGHQSTGSQTATRSTADTASGSPSKAAVMHSQALTGKAPPSLSSGPMVSGHTGLPASTDLRAFPDNTLSTWQQQQQHCTQSTNLSGWLGHTSTGSPTKADTGILADIP